LKTLVLSGVLIVPSFPVLLTIFPAQLTSVTLKMETAGCSKMQVPVHQTTQHPTPEDTTLSSQGESLDLVLSEMKLVPRAS
jgi:hypothetical protein